MQGRAWLRRCIVVAMSTLVVTTGVLVDVDAAHAAKKKKKSSATVAIHGSLSNFATCEGKLTVDIRYTKNGGRAKVSNQAIGANGDFTLHVGKVEKGPFEVTAHVIGHPTHRQLHFDDQTIQARRDRDHEMELGRMRVPTCPPTPTP